MLARITGREAEMKALTDMAYNYGQQQAKKHIQNPNYTVNDAKDGYKEGLCFEISNAVERGFNDYRRDRGMK